MQEELNQFTRNDVWSLVPKTSEMNVIGTKWVFRNKMDEQGIIVRNKARLVAKGYNQEENIDYDETYVPIARIEVEVAAGLHLSQWFQVVPNGCEECILEWIYK